MVSPGEQQHRMREAALFPARRYYQSESESERPNVRLRPYHHHGNQSQRAEVYVVPPCRNLAFPSTMVQKWHRTVLSITEGDIWPIYGQSRQTTRVAALMTSLPALERMATLSHGLWWLDINVQLQSRVLGILEHVRCEAVAPRRRRGAPVAPLHPTDAGESCPARLPSVSAPQPHSCACHSIL
jgi:hypothetical protein